eukprot:scaffold47685_cov55-Phaeocystis_antarctica.AAC.2
MESAVARGARGTTADGGRGRGRTGQTAFPYRAEQVTSSTAAVPPSASTTLHFLSEVNATSARRLQPTAPRDGDGSFGTLGEGEEGECRRAHEAQLWVGTDALPNPQQDVQRTQLVQGRGHGGGQHDEAYHGPHGHGLQAGLGVGGERDEQLTRGVQRAVAVVVIVRE